MLARTLCRTAWMLSLVILAACSTWQGQVGPRAGWKPVARRLSEQIEAEIERHEIPAFSIALVTREGTVWARGFGHEDPARGVPATASTVYRVGSVSKLFTDMALMQLVERGDVDLDAPVQQYLPDFRPGPLPGGGASAEQITLGHLVAHRAGIVRESPVGNYFDPTEPSLEATVASLNSTSLVYPPGTKQKYSNAGIAVVGRVIEVVSGVPFEEYVQQHILRPLGMSSSSFGTEHRDRLARSAMWSYDGRRFDSPTFQLGTGPAGNLMATVDDMSTFIGMLLGGGYSPAGTSIISRESLETMWTPLADPNATSGFGVGFYVSRFGEHRAVGHNGAVYGHSTTFKVLPDAGVGVIAVASLDVTNGVVQGIAEEALRAMLAFRDPDPDRRRQWETAAPPAVGGAAVSAETAARCVGLWRSGTAALEVRWEDGRLWLDDGRSTRRELRWSATGVALVPDDRLGSSPQYMFLTDDGRLKIGDNSYERLAEDLPPPPPERWLGLIGEYGWDHNTLFILEKRGKLYALIEWVFSYPLTEVSENVFDFPDYGLYHGESIIFARDPSGRATKAVAAEVEFVRRDPQDGVAMVFDAEGLRGIELDTDASPPEPLPGLLEADLVDVQALDATIRCELRYGELYRACGAGTDEQVRAFLQRPAAAALVRAHQALREDGYGLLVYDAYRPWIVTKWIFDSTPESLREFVAHPSRGSRHNRGCAVDVTLYDLASGQPVEMGSEFDEFSARSYFAYQGGTARERWFRRLLRGSLEREGFVAEPVEWWHFDHSGWERYPVMDDRFDAISAAR